MSKMSNLTQILDEMVSCGEKLIQTANALKDVISSENTTVETPAPSTKEEPAEVKEEPTTSKKEVTMADVRQVLAAKSNDGFRAEVKQLLTKYGADNLRSVDPKDYESLLKDAEVIGNA